MTKIEAIHAWVERDFDAVPREWIEDVLKRTEEYSALPMWGTMWIVDDFIGERLLKASSVMDDAKGNDYDEEMDGAHQIADTSAYIYEIDSRYVVGVHGAGWNFYDGVWDRLYDICGMQWHKDEK